MSWLATRLFRLLEAHARAGTTPGPGAITAPYAEIVDNATGSELWGQSEDTQVPMGSITEDCFRLCGFLTYRIDHPDDVDDIVGAACDMAFTGNVPIAVLLSQRLIGRKVWSK